jgi:hypothetical protein
LSGQWKGLGFLQRNGRIWEGTEDQVDVTKCYRKKGLKDWKPVWELGQWGNYQAGRIGNGAQSSGLIDFLFRSCGQAVPKLELRWKSLNETLKQPRQQSVKAGDVRETSILFRCKSSDVLNEAPFQ